MSNVKSKLVSLGIDSVKYAMSDSVANAVISTMGVTPVVSAMSTTAMELEFLADNCEDAHLKGVLLHSADFAAQVALRGIVSGLRTNPLINLASIVDMTTMQPKIDAMDAGTPIRMSAQETKQHVADVTEEVIDAPTVTGGTEDVPLTDNAVVNNIGDVNIPAETETQEQSKCALCSNLIAKNSTKHSVVEEEQVANTVIEKLQGLGGKTVCKKCTGVVKGLLNQEKPILALDSSIDEIRTAMEQYLSQVDNLSKEIEKDEDILKKGGKKFEHAEVYQDRIATRRESLQTIQTKYDELAEFETKKIDERNQLILKLNGNAKK